MTERRLRLLLWVGGASLGLSFAVGLAAHIASRSAEGSSWGSGGILAGLLFTLAVLAFPVIGAVIVYRQPRNRIGWLLLLIGTIWALDNLLSGVAAFEWLRHHRFVGLSHVLVAVDQSLWLPGIGLMAMLLLLFPTGTLPSRRWRPVAWMGVGCMVIGPLALLFTKGDITGSGFPDFANPLGFLPLPVMIPVLVVAIAGIPLLVVASAVAVFMRFRRSRGIERLQLKWLAAAAGVVAVLFLLSMVASLLPASSTLEDLGLFSFALIPIAVGVAILKYRLYDIDVVINRTVVYGALAAFITAVYVGIVVGIGALVGLRSGKPNLGLSILATTVVAVAFGPVKERVQRVANRLVYGKRATPYEAFTELSSRMAGAYATEELLPRMARVLAEATGANRTEVWLHLGGRLRREGAWPDGGDGAGPRELALGPGDAIPALPGMSHVTSVEHLGELLGCLALATPGGEPLNPAESKLVQDLASQAGLVMRNVLLMEDLRASRQRIVAAQDEERRRLERDIHDGAQQDLVTLSLAARLAESQLAPDADPKLHELLSAAGAEIKATLSELRELANGIHPAVLTEQGLGPALRSLAERATVPVDVRVDLADRLDPTVEATAYFVVSEALANVGKYADASSVYVTAQRVDGNLRLDVADDGRGGADPSKGSGLRGLQDRVAAVNGSLAVDSPPGRGTRLTAELPCE